MEVIRAKNYIAKAVHERCKESVQEQVGEHKFVKLRGIISGQEQGDGQTSQKTKKKTFLMFLFQPDYSPGYIPYQLTKNGKKKKKKGISKRL